MANVLTGKTEINYITPHQASNESPNLIRPNIRRNSLHFHLWNKLFLTHNLTDIRVKNYFYSAENKFVHRWSVGAFKFIVAYMPTWWEACRYSLMPWQATDKPLSLGPSLSDSSYSNTTLDLRARIVSRCIGGTFTILALGSRRLHRDSTSPDTYYRKKANLPPSHAWKIIREIYGRGTGRPFMCHGNLLSAWSSIKLAISHAVSSAARQVDSPPWLTHDAATSEWQSLWFSH